MTAPAGTRWAWRGDGGTARAVGGFFTGRRARLVAVALVAVAVAHAVVVGRHYFVGSFDDDAGYIVVARALAHGHGLTSILPPGYPLAAAYPPGYAALLAPIAAVDASAFLAFRAVSLALLVVLCALVWVYLGRRRVADPVRLAILAVLALNPVLATYSTMVMAELPFAVLLMATLIAAERWEEGSVWAGLVTVLAGAGMLWTKEAGAGLLVGLAAWLVWRRQAVKSLLLVTATAALASPVVIARLSTGVPILGSRYAVEFGNAFGGGIVHQVVVNVPHAVATYANVVFPQSLIPTSVSPLPVVGPAAAALGTFGTATAGLVLVGFLVWVVDHRDAAVVMIPVYLAETLVYPFLNERRLILVLPVIAAWYVLGARAVIHAMTRVGSRLRAVAGGWRRGAGVALPLLAWTPIAVIAAVLVPQFGRDYLFALGQDSSRPQASPYMELLRRVGAPSDVVETNYVWTTNLFTGHRTAPSAFLGTNFFCYGPLVQGGLRDDGAAFVLTGQLASPPGVGDPCILQFLTGGTSAVRLVRTRRDLASVFELIGPGTPHAGLVDLTAGAVLSAPGLALVQATAQDPLDVAGTYPTAPARQGEAAFTWSWSTPSAVSQVSVGEAGSQAGPTGGVTLELETADGRWQTLTTVPGGVGDGSRVPFLLVPLRGIPALGLRVTVRGTGTLAAMDVHALAGGP